MNPHEQVTFWITSNGSDKTFIKLDRKVYKLSQNKVTLLKNIKVRKKLQLLVLQGHLRKDFEIWCLRILKKKIMFSGK